MSIDLQASPFTQHLPGDPEKSCYTRQVPGACFSETMPTPVADPQLLAHSDEMAELLGIDMASTDVVQLLAGNKTPENALPFAARYGGHQFGNWAGQLGDGRAINLGMTLDRTGKSWELQLKGAGPTPYSRRADGRAVLRSSIREFVCSEAMHHLGVPTTRALSLVLTGDEVMRDMFYDGRPELEPGAIVCRVAPSFIRFGNFEIHAREGEHDVLKRLADHTIEHHFPEIAKLHPGERYQQWFAEVCRRTALLAVEWMRVGFVHGVLNTDNMSIHGLTIDYGPYGFLDDFDPDWTPNTTDASGRRYRYGHQIGISFWNLCRLAEALSPLFPSAEPLKEALSEFGKTADVAQRNMMSAKLGFDIDGELDVALVDGLFETLHSTETDFTIFFRKLANVAATDATKPHSELLKPISEAFYETPDADVENRFGSWLKRYCQTLQAKKLDNTARVERMNKANPKYIFRNYIAQLAIEKAHNGDPSMICEVLDMLRQPYNEQPEHEELAQKRPDWARHKPGCSMLSCSS